MSNERRSTGRDGGSGGTFPQGVEGNKGTFVEKVFVVEGIQKLG